jgi:hypothetical protein
MRWLFHGVVVSLLIAALGLESASAAELTVTNADNYEVKTIDIPRSGTAIIRVYLQSAGEPLSGFEVQLYRVGGDTPLKTETTDISGEAVFVGIGPGLYRVAMDNQKRKTPGGSIRIGDFTVSRGVE